MDGYWLLDWNVGCGSSVTAEQWIPVVEVPEAGISNYLKRKRREGYSILGLEQTANSVSIDKYLFPQKVVRAVFYCQCSFTLQISLSLKPKTVLAARTVCEFF